jgi:hypothetical protein
MKFKITFLIFMFSVVANAQDFSNTVNATNDEVSGALVIAVEDSFIENKSKTHYFINNDARPGVSYEIFFDGEPNLGLQTDMHVKVRGNINGRGLENAQIIKANSAFGALAALPILTPVIGVQKTLVVVLETQESASHFTTAQLHNIMFSKTGRSINTLYQAASFGTVSIEGNVIGPFIVSIPDICDGSSLQRQADKQAVAAGINISDYNHIVYMMPNEMQSICPFSGTAELGGSHGLAWINTGLFSPDNTMINYLLEHELGHRLNMQHAQGIRSDGTVNEYGDYSCVMGGLFNLVEFNVPHRIQAGWLPLTNVQQVKVSGVYQVSFAEQMVNQIQALQIISPEVNGPSIYVSYLQPPQGGIYSNLLNSFLGGASIHLWQGGPNPTQLVSNGSALRDGQTYAAADGSVKITQLSHDATTVTVSVNTAQPAAPTNLKSALWEGRTPYQGRGGLPSLKLTWQAPKDVVGVVGYYIFRDKVKFEVAASTEVILPLLLSDRHSHTYYVVAYDAGGNLSAHSNEIMFPYFQ